MTWALRSQDSTFTTFLADKLLNLYCESGTFSSGDLLDHLGTIQILREKTRWVGGLGQILTFAHQVGG